MHNIARRHPLWNSLKELGEGIIDLCLVIGDFNALLSVEHKVGRLL